LILDTNAVSDLLSGSKQLGLLLAQASKHHLPLFVIAEYEYGLQSLPKPKRLRTLFRQLESDSIVLYPDRETANNYTQIRHELRKQGNPIPNHDLWIAALARQHTLEIISQDHHFDHVEQIRRLGW